MANETAKNTAAAEEPPHIDRTEMLSFDADNDLLPLFPSPPDLEQVLERELTRILTVFHPGIRLALQFIESEKIQYFIVRITHDAMADENKRRLIVFDILDRKIFFPADDILFALVAIRLFGRMLLGTPFKVQKRYCLKRMLQWCACPPQDVYTISRIVFCGFVLGMADNEHAVNFQTGWSAYNRFVEEYETKKSGVIITQFHFKVRFQDGGIRHFRVTERRLTGFRLDSKTYEFELFLAKQNCVEFFHANS